MAKKDITPKDPQVVEAQETSSDDDKNVDRKTAGMRMRRKLGRRTFR